MKKTRKRTRLRKSEYPRRSWGREREYGLGGEFFVCTLIRKNLIVRSSASFGGKDNSQSDGLPNKTTQGMYEKEGKEGNKKEKKRIRSEIVYSGRS
jgi:hypothetical protein